MRPRLSACVLGLALLLGGAGTTRGASFDAVAPRGANYAAAEFRLWVPDGAARLRAVVVLVPGSNDDGRCDVEDAFWQGLARRRGLALLGCRFTDRPHEAMFLEHYAEASKGSGQALVDALTRLGRRAHHPELARAPLLLWGMSAGGEFNYEFVAWRPERVVAFVVNKGGVYYSALLPAAARRVPGILFTGERDLEFRSSTIVGLFALNRRAGALWALAREPGLGHEVGRSRELAAVLFEGALARRLPAGSGSLRPAVAEEGFFGDVDSGSLEPVGGAKPPERPVAWLLDARVARAWQAVVRGRPFEPAP